MKHDSIMLPVSSIRHLSTGAVVLAGLLMLVAAIPTLHAQSGREYRRSNVMAGNRVKTVFGNWGVIGQPATGGPRGSWIYDNNGYLGDVSPLVGAEVTFDGKTWNSVVTTPVDRPTRRRDESPAGIPWGFEPVSGYLNAGQQGVALLTDPRTWPTFWPDKINDATDPGWRGSWNGFFGKTSSSDEEAFFVMDDNNDQRFNVANNNTLGVAFKPDSRNPARNGLGLEMRVRGLQWAQFLAQDNIFWLYEITNTGTTNYNRAVFGMLVGTYIGVTGNDNSASEYDDDFSFFDVNLDLTYTGDYPDNNSRNPSWVGPVGLVGYAFLESPGNPFDGIDNDNDAGFSAAAPFFGPSSFDTLRTAPGMRLVVIDDNFQRSTITLGTGTTTVNTRGLELEIIPGTTVLAEGNIVRDSQGNLIVNPNAYDGVDNDLDGVIDENYYLHFRQLKRDTQGNTLIDILRPVRYVDYITGAGSADLMVDEKRNDLVDNDRDWNIDFDDVGRDGLDGTSDIGEGDGAPTSGYEFDGRDSGLPGEPNIDKTDVDESDQIGLTSFQYFTPSNDITMGDDADMWKRMAPGFFDVPRSIINNRPQRGEDGDFIYGSGYFPLLAGNTERFSLALVFGGGQGGFESDLADLMKHRETVQKIYNSNYRFPVAPEKPTVKAVPGDKQVTLYWDRKAESSFDPVLKEYDFEGYKIYKATDPNFIDAAKITDADGNIVDYKPIGQYDLINQVQGYFRASPDLFAAIGGRSFNLGSNSGLKHSFTDTDVENGRTYYYAVVAYDRGNEVTDILPAENSKRIRLRAGGDPELDVNTVMVVPNAPVAGYVDAPSGVKLNADRSVASGPIFYEVLDALKLGADTYEITFTDVSSDNVDNDNDGKLDQTDADETAQITTTYSVRKLTQQIDTIVIKDTLAVSLRNAHIHIPSVLVKDANGPIDPSRYRIDARRGDLRPASPGSMQGSYEVLYTYFPVFQSPYIKNSPYVSEAIDSDVFDGMQLDFRNDWQIKLIDTASGFNSGTKSMIYNFATTNILLSPGDTLKGSRYPSDYEIRFSANIIDTSAALYGSPAIPVNFTVFNVTDNHKIPFIFVDTDNNRKLSKTDQLALFDLKRSGEPFFSWIMAFENRPNVPADMVYDFTDGDKVIIKTTKPYRAGDVYTFSPALPKVDEGLAKNDLNRVKVVPNPYVSASTHESPLPPGITTGRGERKIDFIHVPAQSKISIFTVRGDHVITLRHESSIDDGTVSWNLKSKENLDIAYGVYFYVLESPVGEKSGKIAIIK
ncbi:MAG TPA: hypothetical protein PK916_14460 [Bacteroidota bacterium]|nr:hypothetical protein [Bacteroidota bacterium]